MSDPTMPQRSKALAYLFWCFCFFQVYGIHRIYAGRYFSGIVYLLTLGCLFIGQFIDLFYIPYMIDEENLKNKALYGYRPNQASFSQTPQSFVINLPQESPPEAQPSPEAQPESKSQKPLEEKDLDRAILKTCKDNQGATIAELFLEIDEEHERLQERVEDLMHKGLLTVDNRPDDGAVIYKMT